MIRKTFILIFTLAIITVSLHIKSLLFEFLKNENMIDDMRKTLFISQNKLKKLPELENRHSKNAKDVELNAILRRITLKSDKLDINIQSIKPVTFSPFLSVEVNFKGKFNRCLQFINDIDNEVIMKYVKLEIDYMNKIKASMLITDLLHDNSNKISVIGENNPFSAVLPPNIFLKLIGTIKDKHYTALVKEGHKTFAVKTGDLLKKTYRVHEIKENEIIISHKEKYFALKL